jgi:hypothetical protein
MRTGHATFSSAASDGCPSQRYAITTAVQIAARETAKITNGGAKPAGRVMCTLLLKPAPRASGTVTSWT